MTVNGGNDAYFQLCSKPLHRNQHLSQRSALMMSHARQREHPACRKLNPLTYTYTHTHTHLTALFRTTWISQYQKGKTNLDLTEARDSEWQWHQLGCMQACTSLQTDNHASTRPLSCFTGRMPFLPPNQQRQSTEGQALTHT